MADSNGEAPVGLARPGLGEKLRLAAQKRRKSLKVGGHDMITVKVNWSTWPGKIPINKHSGTLVNHTAYTCKKCRVFHRGLQKKALLKNRCRGLAPSAKGSTRKLWSQLCLENKKALAEVWGRPLSEVDRWAFSGASGPTDWKRNLVDEGIEPNPGPGFRLWSLNCQSPNGAWALLAIYPKYKK